MAALKPGKYYHIFYHASGNGDIFKEEQHYTYFLKKYQKHITPVANTLAYCLMKDHFHLLIRVIESDKTSDVLKTSDVSKAFKKLFKSYTKSINKENGRKKEIIDNHFKPKRISKNKRIQATFNFIHLNPIFHELCNHPGEWKYSSYNTYIENKDTTLVSVIDGREWFMNLKNMVSNRQPGKISLLVDTL